MSESSCYHKDPPFRICSGCGYVFSDPGEYEKFTQCAGTMCTGSFANFNLKLRNCKHCGSTLSSKVSKDECK